MGRAARNVNGRAIMYADAMTDSMKYAINETERRRRILFRQQHTDWLPRRLPSLYYAHDFGIEMPLTVYNKTGVEPNVCTDAGIPTGTGVINPGGDWNIWQNNWVYGNHYAGFILTWAPGLFREAKTWAEQFDTSHHNRYLDNSMGVAKDGTKSPNGIDFWWDGEGTDNCWQSSRPSGTEPFAVPTCGSGWSIAGPGTRESLCLPWQQHRHRCLDRLRGKSPSLPPAI